MEELEVVLEILEGIGCILLFIIGAVASLICIISIVCGVSALAIGLTHGGSKTRRIKHRRKKRTSKKLT